MGLTYKWNLIDSFIYKVETGILYIKKEFMESEDVLPCVEEMIEAATKQLQIENEQLKKKQHPKNIVFENGNYYCPDCHEQLSNELIKKKYCPECGKRIFYQADFYATSHN